jgi:hypothetical protein
MLLVSRILFVFRPALAINRVTASVTYTSPQVGQWWVRKPLLSPCGLHWIQRDSLPRVLSSCTLPIFKSFAHVISYRMIIRQPELMLLSPWHPLTPTLTKPQLSWRIISWLNKYEHPVGHPKPQVQRNTNARRDPKL